MEYTNLPDSGIFTSLPFFDTVAAGSNKTLVSKIITTPFTVVRINASFALGTNRLMQLYFFVSPDDEAPTTAPPNGYSLLSVLGQVSYLTGDNEQKEMHHNAIISDINVFLKIYAVNSDGFDHTVDASFTIFQTPRR